MLRYIGTNRKPLCDFHCNYVPIFYRFRDITIFGRKPTVFRRFYPPASHFKSSQAGSHGPKVLKVGIKKLDTLGY